MDPCVFNNAKDKFTRLAFRGFVCGEIAEAGLVDSLLPCSYRCLFVVRDGCIIYGRLLVPGGRGSVKYCVCCRVFYETNEVLHSILIIVRNDKEYFLKYLTEFCEM